MITVAQMCVMAGSVEEQGPPGLLRLKLKTKKSFTSHLDWEHMDGNRRILPV